MEYTVEDVSPVKKKINIATTAEEVNAAIAGSVALCKNSVKLDGFRKGKAPASVVEGRFHDHIYQEARDNLINVHINDVLQKLNSKPLSGIQISGGDIPLEKGKGFSYSMEFEVLPQFDLPNYENLEVKVEKTVADEKVVDELLEKIRNERAKLVPAEGTAPARDGQVANLDFEAFENGEPVKDLKVANFNLELGKNEALPDFEKLVKGIQVGHTGEGEVSFPQDFLDEKLAGKTLTMKITVHSVKNRELPPLDDEFAKQLGYDDMAKMREVIAKSYVSSMSQLHKADAQRRLLVQLLKQTDFPLPQTMVDLETRMMLTDLAGRMEMQGKSIKSLGKSLPELIEEMKPRAEDMARNQVLLLAIANKENLEVTDDEVTRDIYRNCLRNGEDFKSTYQGLEQSGMIFHLKDRMLADKAMDMIYAKARVEEVEPGQPLEDAKAEDAAPAGEGEKAE